MTSRDLKQTKKSQPLEKIAGALHFRTPPPLWLLMLIIKKRCITLTVAPTLTLRGVRKCNSAKKWR